MSATAERQFSPADLEALDHYLVGCVSSQIACDAAKVSADRFFDDLLPAIQPYLRGSRVGYSRFANGKTIVDADPVRLDYEIRLAQLNEQHRLCIASYARTEYHGKHVLERYKSSSSMPIPSQRAITGDLRFLHFARTLRLEMDLIETKLKERIEELSGYQNKAQSPPKPAAGVAEAGAASPSRTPPSPPSPPQDQPQNKPQPAQQKPVIQAQIQAVNPIAHPAPIAAQVLRPAANPSPLLKRDDLLAALRNNDIPTIEPPTRKPNKYAGANR